MPTGKWIFPAILHGLDALYGPPLWGWGQIAYSRKISATPPRPSPSIGIDGEGERGGGFNRVLNHFEGRR